MLFKKWCLRCWSWFSTVDLCAHKNARRFHSVLGKKDQTLDGSDITRSQYVCYFARLENRQAEFHLMLSYCREISKNDTCTKTCEDFPGEKVTQSEIDHSLERMNSMLSILCIYVNWMFAQGCKIVLLVCFLNLLAKFSIYLLRFIRFSFFYYWFNALPELGVTSNFVFVSDKFKIANELRVFIRTYAGVQRGRHALQIDDSVKFSFSLKYFSSIYSDQKKTKKRSKSRRLMYLCKNMIISFWTHQSINMLWTTNSNQSQVRGKNEITATVKTPASGG